LGIARGDDPLQICKSTAQSPFQKTIWASFARNSLIDGMTLLLGHGLILDLEPGLIVSSCHFRINRSERDTSTFDMNNMAREK
jgi:hypothetical protein